MRFWTGCVLRLSGTLLLAMFAAFWTTKGPAAENSTDDLREAFKDPPAEFRPLMIVHSRPLHSAEARKWFEARRAGGAVVDSGVKPGSKDVGDEPWDNPTYLNDPGQFDSLRRTIGGLRRRGQSVWIYDELGYPSASAGGRVLAGHPEFQVEVVACRTFRAVESEVVKAACEPERLLACVALPVRDGVFVLEEAEDLTDGAGEGDFQWSAPAGQWAVCLFERFHPDTWRRHNIPRRNVNILDGRAVARFIEITHDRYASELGEQLAEVEAFFTDEPQFGSSEHWSGGSPEALPMVQWCDELPGAFRREKGYDLATVLPALFHPVGSKTAKYRHDFYDVQSDLVAENYFGRIETWCRAHGVASSGHMLLEESLLFHVMFSGSMLKNWARMDLPGVDLLGATPYHTMGGWNHKIVPVPEDFSCKMASSVAHLTEKQGTFTESFALAHKVGLRRVLGVAAWQFAGGITHMTTYGIQVELPAEDAAAFADFVGRMALLTRRGRHVADMAILVPEASVWATYTPPDGGLFRRYFECNPQPAEIDRVFRDTCHTLLKNQRDFDCLGEVLFGRATIQDGQLKLADESFAVLVAPEMRMIRPETLAKIEEFASSGGHVAFVGRLPCQSPEHGDDPGMTRRTRNLIETFPSRVLHVPSPQALPELVEWAERRVPPVLRWEGPASVRLLHRREPRRDIILVANPDKAAVDGQLAVPSAGMASRWNPETGAVEKLGHVVQHESVSLQVPGESARFLVIEGQ